MKPNISLIAALTLTGAVWALTFPLTKIAVTGGYRSFGIIFWSSAISVAVLGGIVVLRGMKLPLNRGALGRYVFVALFGTVLPSAASYTAAVHLPSGVISVCMSIVPMVSFPLAIAVGLDRPSWSRVLGLATGLAGVLLITLPDSSLPDPAQSVFILLVLLAVFCYAIEGVGLGKLGRAGLDPIQLLLGASIIAAVAALPVAVLTHTFIVPAWPLRAAEAAVMLSGVANAAAYVGYVWIVGRGGPVFAAQVAYIVTGFGVVWSMLLLGETYSLWIWTALAAIFAGLFLIQPRPAAGGAKAAALPTAPELTRH